MCVREAGVSLTTVMNICLSTNQLARLAFTLSKPIFGHSAKEALAAAGVAGQEIFITSIT